MNSNDLIDRVAHGMTDVAPGSDLRAAVLARLDVQPRRGWIRLAMPAVAAGLVAVLFALTRAPHAVPESPRVPQVARKAATTPAQHAALSTLGRDTTQRVRAVTAPALTAEEIAWLQRALPALNAMPALGVDSIQPEAIQIAPISVEPIAVEPIVIPDGAARAGDRERH